VAEELNNFQAAQEWLDHQARVLAERVPHEGEQDTSLSPEEISWRQTALGESMLSYLKAMKMSDFVRIALETLGIHEWSELQAVGQEFESQEDELEQEIDKSLEKARDAYKKIQQALKSMEQLLGANNNSADEEYL